MLKENFADNIIHNYSYPEFHTVITHWLFQGKDNNERKKELERKDAETKSAQAQKSIKRMITRVEDSMSSNQKEQIAKFR